MTPSPGAPRVSVILATAEPGEALARALRSVLANDGSPFEVWIVGTTPGPSPELGDDPRIRWTRSAGSCSAAAHNAAIAAATGEILAITDEDCEVESTWIEEMVRAFERDDRIGVVFGAVEPARKDDPSMPGYSIESEFLARRPGDKARIEGIWACMGVRRRTWKAVGGFDERFGRGARFPGCADADLAIRALAAGAFVLETPRVRVRSYRSLSPEEHRRAVEGYTYAAGALLGTHLRARTPGALRHAAALFRRRAGKAGHRALGSGADRPAKRVGPFLRGLAVGAIAPTRQIG